jgi:hypothetical protein
VSPARGAARGAARAVHDLLLPSDNPRLKRGHASVQSQCMKHRSRGRCCCLKDAHMNLGYACARQKLHSSAPLLLLLCTPRRAACAGLAAAGTKMITRSMTSADPATSCCETAAAELKSVRTLPPGQQSSGYRMRTTQPGVAQSIFFDSFVHC